jgi:hypothetical protein
VAARFRVERLDEAIGGRIRRISGTIPAMLADQVRVDEREGVMNGAHGRHGNGCKVHRPTIRRGAAALLTRVNTRAKFPWTTTIQ